MMPKIASARMIVCAALMANDPVAAGMQTISTTNPRTPSAAALIHVSDLII
jgi:hypothetical protein